MFPNFDEALARFRIFLNDCDFPRENLWIGPSDVVMIGKKTLYVKLPVSDSDSVGARRRYELGAAQKLGVQLLAVCDLGVRSGC
jgi:hypothetical protein